MTVPQARFAEAVLDPGMVLPGLVAPGGGPAGKRLDVYRNNVASGLIAALATGFPVLARLLGDRFAPVAAGFVRAHPPASPVLQGYGGDLPDYLAAHEVTAEAGYLPDVARLELALRAAYHARDAAPVDPARLAAIPAARLAALRLTLAPALRLVRSDWPVHAIWRYHQPDPGPPPRMAAEDVLVVRPGYDPAPWLLPPGGAEAILALLAGRSLGEAQAAAGDGDMAAILSLLLAGEAITGLDPAP